jgi:hypothetical protein
MIMGLLESEMREHTALRQLVDTVQDWHAASGIVARGEALRRYNEAAATLVGLGVTLYDLDPMYALPDDLMPLVWQDAYAEAFAGAVMISAATHRATLAG